MTREIPRAIPKIMAKYPQVSRLIPRGMHGGTLREIFGVVIEEFPQGFLEELHKKIVAKSWLKFLRGFSKLL